MDTLDALLSRRTVHFYRTDPVDDDILERALQAAIMAPNHKLTNPWRFTRVGPTVREQITNLGVSLKLNDDAPDVLRKKVHDKLHNPPILLVVSQPLDPDDFRRREDYAACACAIQNLMLALHAQGVGSKWSTGGVTRHEQTYHLLQLDPALEEIIGFIWIGYPRDDEQPTPMRDPLDEVLHQTS